MADPISSRNINDSANACIDGDGEASAASAASSPPPPASTAPATSNPSSPPAPPPVASPVSTAVNAVKGLVSRFTPSVEVKTNVTTEGPVPGASSYKISQSAFSAKVTSGPFKGSGVEAGNVSATAGKDKDVQLNGLRVTRSVTVGGFHYSSTADLGSVRANLGTHNDDGSVGGNLGIGGDAVGDESTIDTGYGSVTYGESVSDGVSGSLGVRDADHDGKPEYCAKFSVPAFTIGACIERPW